MSYEELVAAARFDEPVLGLVLTGSHGLGAFVRPQSLVERKGVLPKEAAMEIADAGLDAYINAYYRSAKNALSGLDTEARLDAAESVSPFLTALFALHRRGDLLRRVGRAAEPLPRLREAGAGARPRRRCRLLGGRPRLAPRSVKRSR